MRFSYIGTDGRGPSLDSHVGCPNVTDKTPSCQDDLSSSSSLKYRLRACPVVNGFVTACLRARNFCIQRADTHVALLDRQRIEILPHQQRHRITQAGIGIIQIHN